MAKLKVYIKDDQHQVKIPVGVRLLIRRCCQAVLTTEGFGHDTEVSVSFVDNKEIRKLNNIYRQKDAETDVLSFPQNELKPGQFDASLCESDPQSGRVLLGDMMISLPRCAAQGKEFGHGFNRELCYLTVHSVLHLLGYDHVDEGEMKAAMRKREKEIMEDE